MMFYLVSTVKKRYIFGQSSTCFTFISGDRMIDYMNMDDRSIGMFWVVTYTMAQPACETVMNWLSSAGVTEWTGSNLQPNERLMVTREVSPLPMSLLSGFSLNLCLKLAYQMEEALFGGQVVLMFLAYADPLDLLLFLFLFGVSNFDILMQVVPSIAMVETYTRLLLHAPHSLFRSHFSVIPITMIFLFLQIFTILINDCVLIIL